MTGHPRREVTVAHPPDDDVELMRATLSRIEERYAGDPLMREIVWMGLDVVCLFNARIVEGRQPVAEITMVLNGNSTGE